MKYLKYLLAGILLLSLCGCAMNRGLLAVVKGTGIKPTLGSSVPLEAEEATIVIYKGTALGEGSKYAQLKEVVEALAKIFGVTVEPEKATEVITEKTQDND